MKRKLVIVIICTIFFVSLFVGFAAFMFNRSITGDAGNGSIELIEKKFVLRGDVNTEIDAKERNSISCNATKKGGYDEEMTYELNQLGVSYTFSSSVDVYMRINFEDAWISVKTYNNGTRTTTYIEKGKVSGVSPFSINDSNWVYDSTTNCAYYKGVIKPGDTKTFTYNLNSSYYYETKSNSSYRECVLVEVSYFVDIVQANRAEKKWGVRLSEIFGGSV